MPTALISVSDKSGLDDFTKQLKKIVGPSNLHIIATSSTAKYLKECEQNCDTIDSVTQFPEILDGRVKTLHPKIFGGILSRDLEKDRESLKQHGIPEIDLVIVNLYPFGKKLKEGLPENEMIEQIDIGGVTLIRAAAKNFSRVVIACMPSQYKSILEELRSNNGTTSISFRRKLAEQAFAHTANYDHQIANYFLSQVSNHNNGCQLAESLNLNLKQYQPLRYGENPHQAAIWYQDMHFESSTPKHESFPPFEQLQGKELSSNNITDTYCLVSILRDIQSPSACIIKHNNPCGVAVGNNLEDAYKAAYSTDPDAAFGGIYGFTGIVTARLAEQITENFVEIVAAPDYESESLAIFQKKKNLRVLRLKPNSLETRSESGWHLRDLQDFGCIIEKEIEPPKQAAQFENVVGGTVTSEELADAAFAWSVVKHLTSNAIFIAKNRCSLGFGIGQTSRIASVRIALEQAGQNAQGAVLASDAFFPATDSIEAAATAGISMIIQPGGSIKDKEVIAACEKSHIKMLFTGQRVFKH